jgi:hypothetical protein
MITNHLIRNMQEPPMRAFRALDSRLFTYALNPLICACGSIAGFPGLAALKAAWINIVATAEERPEERDLVLRVRTVMDALDRFHGRGYRSS